MNSAAVIGRQLRQQQASSRTSGPVVPPTQSYKGRAHSNSIQSEKQDRDLLSLATQSNLGVDADKKFAKFSQQFSHEFFPHPAHREKAEKGARDKEKKKKEPQLRLNWHCFCIAFKALSSGIVLFVAGLIMSVIGFFADSLSQDSAPVDNGTEPNNTNGDVKSNLHNLTYVGPVVMGLGGIVIVAACVLTFEVRDTLGVKTVPPDKEEPPEKDNHQMNTSQLSSATSSTDNNTANANHFHSSRQSGHKRSEQSHRQHRKSRTDPKQQRPQQRLDNVHISSCNQPNSNANAESANEVVGNFVSEHTSKNVVQAIDEDPRERHLISSVKSMSGQDLFAIDIPFTSIPSPDETELSDPEGCSLSTMSRWKSRCSCSGSPSNSMLLALHNLSNDFQPSPLVTYGDYSRHQTIPRFCQLPQRNSKILASVESDGLSSSSSSEWNYAERHQAQQAQHHLDRYMTTGSELPCNAFYLSSHNGHNGHQANHNHHYQANQPPQSHYHTYAGPSNNSASPKVSEGVSLQVPAHSVAVSIETRTHKVSYPLLQVSSLEWLQAKSDHCTNPH